MTDEFVLFISHFKNSTLTLSSFPLGLLLSFVLNENKLLCVKYKNISIILRVANHIWFPCPRQETLLPVCPQIQPKAWGKFLVSHWVILTLLNLCDHADHMFYILSQYGNYKGTIVKISDLSFKNKWYSCL